tara:strand:+ start:434 stop:691 length:258 start_codon:yes stop_codon:yes gene_type:complete
MRQPSLFQAPSEWIPPENIPNLEEATEIAIDLETHDPGLKSTGPGWAIKKGKVIGVRWPWRVGKDIFLLLILVVVTSMRKFLNDN